MRWDRLFDDLEGPRSRRLLERDAERGGGPRPAGAGPAAALHDRLLACVGQRVTLVCGAGQWPTGPRARGGGRVGDARRPPGVVLAHVPAVRSLAGLGQHTHVPGGGGPLFGLGMALRAVCRDRAPGERCRCDRRRDPHRDSEAWSAPTTSTSPSTRWTCRIGRRTSAARAPSRMPPSPPASRLTLPAPDAPVDCEDAYGTVLGATSGPEFHELRAERCQSGPGSQAPPSQSQPRSSSVPAPNGWAAANSRVCE